MGGTGFNGLKCLWSKKCYLLERLLRGKKNGVFPFVSEDKSKTNSLIMLIKEQRHCDFLYVYSSFYWKSLKWKSFPQNSVYFTSCLVARVHSRPDRYFHNVSFRSFMCHICMDHGIPKIPACCFFYLVCNIDCDWHQFERYCHVPVPCFSVAHLTFIPFEFLWHGIVSPVMNW